MKGKAAMYSYSHPVGQILVTWALLPAREVGKRSLHSDGHVAQLNVLFSMKEEKKY